MTARAVLVVLSILSAHMLGGCATPYRDFGNSTALPDEARGSIRSTRAIVGLDPANDNNTHTTYVGHNQGGLIGAVVLTALARGSEASQQTKQRSTQSIREAIIQFNFGSRYRMEFEKGVRSLAWLGTTSVSREPVLQRDKVETTLSELSEDALLISDVFYKIDSDLSKIVLTTYVGLYPRDERLKQIAMTGTDKDSIPTLYRNKFTYEYALDGSDLAAVTGSAPNSAATVTRALETGITELVKMIVLDMQRKPLAALQTQNYVSADASAR